MAPEDKSAEEAGFKVVDKRRFTEDGESRTSDAADTESAEVKAEVKKVVEEKAGPEQAAEAPHSQAASQPAGSQQAYTVDFPSFIISLATQAMMMMGEMPNPESNLISENLEGARQTIDILALLEEKTQGNLTAEERQLMTEVLASLRMSYVKKRG